jgi:hypothetical protein
MDLVLISSVINISNKPLSYSPIRSVYTKQERYEQTIRTIKSIEKIKNKKVLFVESSDILEYENEIINMVDFYKNIYKDDNIKNIIDGPHKGVGESISILEGLKDIDLSLYDNIYKISGRYWLTDKFNYSLWDNDNTMFFNDKRYNNNIATVFYKINNKQYDEWISLLNTIYKNTDVSAIEVIFKNNMKNYSQISNIGITGFMSYDGLYYEA